MGTRRRTRPPRSDDELLQDRDSMLLLEAVATGRVVRGADGTDQTANAPFMLDGRPVRFQLRRLADEDLVHMPLSGPPSLWGFAPALLQRWRTSE